MDFSPDGQFLATADNERGYLWDATTGEEIASLDEGSIISGGFTSDGQYLILTRYDRPAESYSVQVRSSQSYLDDDVVALSPDGQFVAVAETIDRANTLRVWWVDTGELLSDLPHPLGVDQIIQVFFSADGAYLISRTYNYESTSPRSIIRVWVPISEELITQREYGYYLNNFVLSGYDTSNERYTISLLTIDGQEIIQTTSEDAFYGLVFSPNSVYLVAQQYESSDSNYVVRLWQIDLRHEVSQISIGNNYFQPITFSPDGEYLGLASENTVRLYRVATRLEAIRINHERNTYIQQFFFNQDGTYLMTIDYNSLNLWVGSASSDTHLPVRLKIEHEAAVGSYGFQVVAPRGIADSRDFGVFFEVVPGISRISPHSSPPGRTIIASVIGRGLAGATAIEFLGTGIRARILSGGSHAVVRMELSISSNAPIGSQAFQIVLPSGILVDSRDFGIEFLVYGYPYGYGAINLAIGGDLIASWEDN